MVIAPKSQVTWPRTHRLILSCYPPIDLFDDVADPHDWEILARAEARTNPRIYEEIGNLALVPPERRLAGDGASWVMGAFTHVSTDRPTRFSNGNYGIYYAGDSIQTAIHEHAYHMARTYANTAEDEGWISEVRQLVGTVDAELVDIRGGGFDELLDKTDYAAANAFGAAQRAANENGIVYPSQRNDDGECIAALFPDVVTPPDQGDHYSYHWNGETIDYVKQLTGNGLVFELKL